MRVLWRIRLPDVLIVNARCQLPILIASATAGKVGLLALWC